MRRGLCTLVLSFFIVISLAAGAAKGVGVVEGRDSLAMASDHLEREYDFVEEPLQTFFCPVSLAVLLEPYQTQCCGNHLSEEAYQRLQGQPCPLCRKENITAVKDLFHKRNVLSLKVRCPHKEDGCEWEGELGSLEEHTNRSEGDKCRYVEVNCPYSCGERVQRRNLEEHKSQHCPLRPSTCQYCNHEATYQEVIKEHWPVCEKYPLPCPNACGEKNIERQHLKGHMEQTCPVQVIECELSYAGCGAQLQRRCMPAHMKADTEAHLSLVAQVSKVVPELQVTVQQLIDQNRQQEYQIKQQADQIKQQGDQISALIKLQQGKLNVSPTDITMQNFKEHKFKDDVWYSPPIYSGSHAEGYKMRLEVYANGFGAGKGTHVSVYVCLMRGEFDDHLKWPFNGEVTVKLQFTQWLCLEKKILLDAIVPDSCVTKPTEELNERWGISKFISHADLYCCNRQLTLLNYCILQWLTLRVTCHAQNILD